MLEIDGDNVEAHFYRAHAFFEEGIYGQSLLELDNILKTNPDYSNALLTRARALEKLSRMDEAIQAYMAYIKTAPPIYQSNIDLARNRLDEILKTKPEQKED